jgi:hypothetical protein
VSIIYIKGDKKKATITEEIPIKVLRETKCFSKTNELQNVIIKQILQMVGFQTQKKKLYFCSSQNSVQQKP